jgi:hypothetical protein
MTTRPDKRPKAEVSGGLVLQRLGLTVEERAALARQGFLATERRGGMNPIYKLRFRLHGRQVVKYVGTNPDVAKAIRGAVAALQQDRRQARRLRRLAEEAQRTLRRAKRELGPLLEAAGLRFHGYAVRRPATRVKV